MWDPNKMPLYSLIADMTVRLKPRLSEETTRALLSQRWPRDAPYIYISYSTLILFTLTATILCADLILDEFKVRKFYLFLQERRFGRSRSSEVIDFGANRKRVCDFLLDRNSNLCHVLPHFGDMTAFMCSWPHLYSTLILGCSRCTRSPMLGLASA